MKKTLIPFAAIALLAACNDAPKADNAGTTDKQEVKSADGTSYAADKAVSTVTWTGTKPGGSHAGNFKLSDGSLMVKEGAITGGSFVIDINSMDNTDLAADTAQKHGLEGHLKSPDFFDAAKYPTAKFEITGVTTFKYDSLTMKDVIMKDATHTINGNLTLKDSTKNVSFPAKVTMSDAQVTAMANFNIDRTLWGMNYKGPKNPQDWIISKTVNLALNITANKK